MAYAKPRIGFVGTTMSGFDALLDTEEVRDMSQYQGLIDRMIEKMSEFAELVNFDIVGNEVEATDKSELIASENCDLLFVWPFNYTLDVVVLKLVSSLHVPIVLLNTMPVSSIDENEDFGMIMENNAVACIPTITNVLIKNHIPYYLVSGAIDSEQLYEKIKRLAKASSTARMLRSSRIGRIGYTYPGISAISVDDSAVTGHFGVELVPINIREIAAEYSKVEDSSIIPDRDQLKARTHNAGISEEEITASIRLRPALDRIVEKYEINALVQLCQLIVADPNIGIVPCYANTCLVEKKIPVTCECDVMTAIAMLILQEYAENVIFMEFYRQDFEKGFSLLSHCGQGNLNVAQSNRPVLIKKHPAYQGGRGLGISYEYEVRKGIVTYACLVMIDGKWRMVAGVGESLEEVPRPTSTVQMYFKFNGDDFNSAYERFCNLGGIHHLALGYGDHLDDLKAVCAFIDVEFYSPDE